MSFLPGMHPGFIFGGASIVPIIACDYVDHEYATDDEITLPSDIEFGDLIVLVRKSVKADPPPASYPVSGYTNFQSVSRSEGGLGKRYEVDAKIATGSEGSTTLTVAASAIFVYALVFRPNRPLVELVAGGSDDAHSSGNPDAAVIPASESDDQPCVAIGWISSTGGIDTIVNESITPNDQLLTEQFQFYCGFYFQTDGTDDVVVDQDDANDDNSNGGVWIGLT